MTKSNNNHFLSQRVQKRSPPILLRQRKHGQFVVDDECPGSQSLDARVESTNQFRVKIEERTIPLVPTYYALEPRSMTIKGIPLDIISRRISEFLRLNSISYATESQTCHLHCCSFNMVRFCIQFWKANPHDDPNESVILEVQRRQGSCIDMQQIRRALIRAVLSGEQIATENQSKRFAVPHPIIAEIDTHFDNEKARNDAGEICVRLLESALLDQFQMGMESLRILTDPSMVSVQDATYVSHMIIFQEGRLGQIAQDKIVECFKRGTKSLSHSMGTDGGSDSLCGSDSLWDYIRSLSLTILGNSLNVLVSNDEAKKSANVIDLHRSFWKAVIDKLSTNMLQATEKPSEGALSAKCIRLLLTFFRELDGKQILAPLKLHGCLSEAVSYGQERHRLLEMESTLLLGMES